MPITINCPSCSGPVQVPEELLGKRVRCPRCNGTFVAEEQDEPEARMGPKRPAAEAGPYEGKAPARRPRRPDPDDLDGDYADDDYDRPRRRRRSGRPHRGGAVLTLGILSLVVGCGPLGIAAWVMGNNDLAEMRRGEMDREGEGITQAGRICGMISCILMIVGCVVYGGIIVLAGAAGGFR